ncbi:transporter substrate-binding domain-containing protein [Pseudothauera nasutitermitis]|uniref:Transporter substrate-binding domain-containing protein n=1 Tax=Pseudothauera nasutitermitis TaxID=2565930 RepID=A0A4S4B6D7_9RHOO|nr:transporter substrate-binding domain-containing protein [Pseudothauera nasutitermitis]THF66527.1 transporter substrate-binding domain-containing protein [Pseudothauera nasutitermitis]
MSNQRRNFLRSALAGAALLACASLPAHADTLADIQRNGTLRVAVPQDFPPFGSVGTDLKPQGYDIDTAALIARELGVKVELIPVTSTNRIPFLTTGKADLVISSLGKNAERELVIDFSDAYAPFFNGVFGPEDAAVATVADLDGKTVGVTRGSVEDLELSKIASDKVTIRRFEDNNATISAYLTGQVQFIATGNVVAAAVNDLTKLRRLSAKFLIKNSPCYVGVAKGQSALLTRVNEIIAKAKTDGSLEAVSQRWLKAPLPADL